MIEGIKPFRVMIRHAVTEEIREYLLPVDGPQMVADLITWIPEMDPSRRIDGGFRGSLQRAMEGSTGAGYVGPYLEIRKLDGDTEPSASVTVMGEVIRQRAIEDPTDPAGHEPECTCLFCIPGM